MGTLSASPAPQALYSETPPPRRRALWIAFLLLALLLHLFLMRMHVDWNGAPAPAPVEVVQVDPNKLNAVRNQWKKRERQLLLDKNQPKSETAPPDAKYFSDRNIRVEKEQRAKHSNVVPTPEKHAGSSAAAPSKPHPPLNSLGVPMHLSDKTPTPAKHERPDPVGNDHENSRAADQSLADRMLPEGSENLLNAQESVFYSFYARLYESIGPIWQSDLRASRPQQRIQPGDYQTVVDVVLDAEGNLVDVRLLQSSGIESFDQSVFRSWKRIPRFPNPPRGLLDATGRVHMGWSFTVQVDTNFMLQYLPPERQG